MYVRACIRNRCVVGKHMNYNVTTLFQRARIHSSHLHYIHAYIHSYNFTSLWTVRRYGLCSMVCAGCSLSKYFNNMHKAYASDAHSKWSEIDSAHMYGVRACVHTSSPSVPMKSKLPSLQCSCSVQHKQYRGLPGIFPTNQYLYGNLPMVTGIMVGLNIQTMTCCSLHSSSDNVQVFFLVKEYFPHRLCIAGYSKQYNRTQWRINYFHWQNSCPILIAFICTLNDEHFP